MTETSRRKLDTRCKTQLWVTWKLGVGFTVVKKVLGRKRSLKSSEKILCRNTVTCKMD